jgi:hypothetical protein
MVGVPTTVSHTRANTETELVVLGGTQVSTIENDLAAAESYVHNFPNNLPSSARETPKKEFTAEDHRRSILPPIVREDLDDLSDSLELEKNLQ